MTSTCFNAQTRNIVAEVANQLGAVVTLGARDGQGVVCIANASGNRTERVLADEVHISRHASALGKLLMAQLPWPKAQERIDRYRLPALTENSVSDINILRAQLISARRHDIATEHGETIAGQSCIAVGISRRGRHTIAALSICVPSARQAISTCSVCTDLVVPLGVGDSTHCDHGARTDHCRNRCTDHRCLSVTDIQIADHTQLPHPRSTAPDSPQPMTPGDRTARSAMLINRGGAQRRGNF
jgi:hypothetical protein